MRADSSLSDTPTGQRAASDSRGDETRCGAQSVVCDRKLSQTANSVQSVSWRVPDIASLRHDVLAIGQCVVDVWHGDAPMRSCVSGRMPFTQPWRTALDPDHSIGTEARATIKVRDSSHSIAET